MNAITRIAAIADLADYRDPIFAHPEREGERRRYRTIWVSDVHLGTRGCNADMLIDFLDHTDSETMYLVGDIIDGWRLRRKWYWPAKHNDIVWRVMKRAKRGTRVVYIPGNHDEMFRQFTGMTFGDIEIRRKAGSRLEAEAFEALLELGNAAATVQHLLVAAGPGRVRLRVDFEIHRCASRTPGRAGFVLGAVGHHDLDGVVVGMDISLHDTLPACSGGHLSQWIATARPKT